MLCRVVAAGSSSFDSPSFLARRSIDRMTMIAPGAVVSELLESRCNLSVTV